MNFSDLAVLANTAELSLAEKGIASAKVVLTGFVVVFAVLVLLIFIIKIYGGIVTKAQQSGNKKKKEFYKACRIIMEGFSAWFKKHADYCEELAKTAEGEWIIYFNAAYFDSGNNKDYIYGVNEDGVGGYAQYVSAEDNYKPIFAANEI